ncbi:MAG: glycosyltransferase [Desulfobacterales bacterium]|nr:glycosyltransferase [Desulfobacterales bacterium]
MHKFHDQDQPRIAIFVSFSGKGGVERMLINLMGGLTALGCKVDLLPVKTRSLCLSDIPSDINVIPLNTSHTRTSLKSLVRYLKNTRPRALLAAKDRANQTAILARFISGVKTRIVVRVGTTVSAALEGKGRSFKYFRYLPMRVLYPRADEIVVVSQGVAREMARITGLPVSHFHVLANPVISSRMTRLAYEKADRPWFNGPEPLIVGAGRLTRQKDFITLIKAFAGLQARCPSRLVILGEGRDRSKLEALATDLGIGDRVDLPGHTSNPYAYMRRASLFVLSSMWEGSPNVLTEALALGTPVVATDCPSGPRDILANGRYGELVPVGDDKQMADAMFSTLANPPEKNKLLQAVKAYTVENSSKKYLEILLGDKGRAEE